MIQPTSIGIHVMTTLANAQRNPLINNDVVDTLTKRGFSIQLEMQTSRPDLNWSFYGKSAYVQYATDLVIDTEVADSVSKFRKIFKIPTEQATVLPIYLSNNLFSHLADTDSNLVGYAVMGMAQAGGDNKFSREEVLRENKLNEQAICFDLEDLTLWKNREIFQAYLTDANGDLVAYIKDIKNHHRDVEVAVNRSLKSFDAKCKAGRVGAC